MMCGGQRRAPSALPQGKRPSALLKRKLGGPPGPARTGTESLTSTGIRSPGSRARSESIYRLSYPDPRVKFLHYSGWIINTGSAGYKLGNIYWFIYQSSKIRLGSQHATWKVKSKGKGKAFPLQYLTGPEGSSR
jgi:hypothetical protein